jgi:hypothetical protein
LRSKDEPVGTKEDPGGSLRNCVVELTDVPVGPQGPQGPHAVRTWMVPDGALC